MNYRRAPGNSTFGNATSYRTEELQVRALLKFEKIPTQRIYGNTHKWVKPTLRPALISSLQ